MKNYTKFIAIFLVLAVLLSIPVFANADSGWHNITVDRDMVDFDAVYYNPSTGEAQWLDLEGQTTEQTYWKIPAITGDSSTITFVNDFPTLFTVSAGDVISIDSFTLKWFIGGTTNVVSKYRICLGSSPLNPDFSSHWISTGYTFGQASQRVQVPNITINVNKALTVQNFFIQFEMYHPEKGLFGLYYFDTSIEYGNPDSPQAPGYTKPDGGAIDDYHDLEQDVLNDTQSGMNAANGIFGGFVGNIFGFVSGLLFVSELMGLFIVKVPAVGLLIQISLALGLFGVLVGLSGSIIGAKERHDRNVAYRNRVYWERDAANNRRKMREARGSRRKK